MLVLKKENIEFICLVFICQFHMTDNLVKRIYLLMTNKLKSSKLKYLPIRYLRKYIKLPILLFTFIIFKDSFSE